MANEIKQECALCLARTGRRILFVRQAYDLHLWTLPGGTVEPGESYSEAAIREFHEETGLIGKVNSLVCFRTRANQTIAVFGVDILGGELAENVPGEIEAIRWLDEEEISHDPRVELFSQYVALNAITEEPHALGHFNWTGGSGPADMFI